MDRDINWCPQARLRSESHRRASVIKQFQAGAILTEKLLQCNVFIIQVLNRPLGARDYCVAASHYDLGRLLETYKRDPTGGEAEYLRCADILMVSPPPLSATGHAANAANFLYDIGIHYAKVGKIAMAEKVFQRSLEYFADSWGRDSASWSSTSKALAEVQARHGPSTKRPHP